MKCTHIYISTHGRCLTCEAQVYPSKTLRDRAVARANRPQQGVVNYDDGQ